MNIKYKTNLIRKRILALFTEKIQNKKTEF